MNYKLLTPGPLTTSAAVKEVMQVDHCTWDEDYKIITQKIRQRLLELAGVSEEEYTAILMQGSGSFGVEAVLSSVLGSQDKLLICVNGAYGERMVQMAKRHGLSYSSYEVPENEIPDAAVIQEILQKDADITALAMVHSETTSGILNELTEIAKVVHKADVLFLVDAMSSFGGIPIDVKGLDVDFLISSSNKCIQGVPGFSFIICKKEALDSSEGNARTVSLDIHDQYKSMAHDGKWRFTSPTHTVLAFEQALKELEEEGGIEVRYTRYLSNNQFLRQKMEEIGFEPYIHKHQGPFITSFLYPKNSAFQFQTFYSFLKERGYAIYPGKINSLDCFRIGNIGDIYLEDMNNVTQAIYDYMEEIANEN